MALPNARDQYLKTQVETASKEQLVVMLFDGIVRFTEQARKAIEEKQIEESHHFLMRAQAIVMELICTVDQDKGGDVAKNIMALHAYSFNCLIQCNMHKDVSKIDEVQKIYRDLREGWVGAMEQLGIGPKKGQSSSPAAGKPQATAPAAARPAAAIPPRPVSPAPIPKSPFGLPKVPGQKPTGPAGGGILASNAKPAAIPARPAGLQMPAMPTMPGSLSATPAAKAPVAPATPAVPAAPVAAPAPAAPYGMGRTAMMMGAYGKAPVPAAPAAATPAAPVNPATPAPSAAAAQKPMMNAKQAAMLSAYQSKTRNIA